MLKLINDKKLFYSDPKIKLHTLEDICNKAKDLNITD